MLREVERFEEAVRKFIVALDVAAQAVALKIGKAEAGIFEAQKQIMLDATVRRQVLESINTKRHNAEQAVFLVFRKFEDEYLRERARDLADIRHRLLDQYLHYAEVIKLFPGKPVTFRMLDIGGDKALPFLNIEKEENPCLGWRGARFLLGNPDLFNCQVRALARVSLIGKVKIMFPLVVDAAQLRRLLDAAENALRAVAFRRENLEFGAMFEVPSTCLQAREIFKLADFGSIGSNDLIQYLFAVDRNNEHLQTDYNPEHPVLWDVIRDLAQAARDAKKPLSICGEMASQPGLAAKLLVAGVKSLSVSPRFVPRVREEMIQHHGSGAPLS